MINWIHDRLLDWASASLSDSLGALGYSSLASLGSDCSSDRSSVALWSPAIEEIERAVLSLPEIQRDTIKEIYLTPGITMEQVAKKLSVSSRSVRRFRNDAHKNLEKFISENKVLNSTCEKSSCTRVRFVEFSP